MQLTARNIILAAALLAAQVDAGIISELARRQATCKECPLNPGNIVKQIYEMVANPQSTDNCRWEATFGLPQDLGGPSKPSYDHLSKSSTQIDMMATGFWMLIHDSPCEL